MRQRWKGIIVGLWLCMFYTTMGSQADQKPEDLQSLRKKYDAALQEISRLQHELETLRNRQKDSNDHAPATDFFLAGNAYVNLRKYREAVAAYTRAIAQAPQDALAFRNRGIARIALGAPQQALNDLDKSLELAPLDAVAYNHRGITHYALNNVQQAARDFTKALELNPKLAEAYNNRGLAAHRLGNEVQARKDFTSAAQLGMEVASQHLKVLRDDIHKVQRRLQAAGLNPGQADGVMGPQTATALRQYQRTHSLPVTGLLDEATRMALGLIPLDPLSSLALDNTSPRFVSQPRPDYPIEARRQGWEGTVTLQLELLADGKVGEVKMAKSSGHEVLDAAAREAAKMWTHAPVMQSGQTVTRWTEVKLTFTLNNDSKTKKKQPNGT